MEEKSTEKSNNKTLRKPYCDSGYKICEQTYGYNHTILCSFHLPSARKTSEINTYLSSCI